MLATGNDNCVGHGKSPLNLLTRCFIGGIVDRHGCTGPEGPPRNCVRQGVNPRNVQGPRFYASRGREARAARPRLDSPPPHP
ncbi:hypothetical protein FOB65_15410 [Pseudomonas oryzihabitans]|nr:hypothetical protein FOB65_15410 [Pseudomonas oryzihabitans]